jgi:hypothetical protein
MAAEPEQLTREEAQAIDLAKWWLDKAEEEIAATIPKMREYSSSDLQVMGTALDSEDTQRGMEAAIAFYVLGKIARAVGALQEGRAPSDDTWFDISVYAKMAMRVRERGRWP